MQNNNTNKQAEHEQKPNEAGEILVDEHIKIFDPNSGEVLIDKRETK